MAFSMPAVKAGHEVTYYPSYYPQEITLHAVAPAAAADRLRKNELHAYLGATPKFSGAVPEHLEPVESLDGFLVLSFDPASKAFADREERCAAGRGIIQALDAEVEGVVLVPYPVTPFHPDYLHHLDRIEETKAELATDQATPPDLKVAARGERATKLVGDRWPLQGERWDVRLERVRLSGLRKETRLPLTDQPSPPWLKQGWYQAYQLLSASVADRGLKKNADTRYQRLTEGKYQSAEERLNLERRLVADLTAECRRMVAGYTLRREYYSADLSGGIENVAYDGQAGMNAAVFVRTAKLKDFPWNGWLNLGLERPADAAWNPVAGFTDPAGRLIWSAIGDAALVPMPYNGSFIENRVSADAAAAEGRSLFTFKVPPAALSFKRGSGELRLVGAGKTSGAKISYRVNASINLDGSKMEVSDLLYAYAFAFRWGEKANADDAVYDPAVDAATRLMRERLVGLKPIKVESQTNQLAPDIQYTRETPIVEVYLNHGSGDPLELAAIAPPWSAVPWHLVVLMEEAVKRKFAAFSEAEAKRNRIAWLDLVRDPDLHTQLRALIDDFESEGYRPEALLARVSREDARARWTAVKNFADKNSHLLVTNGPYRLKSWSEEKTALEVVRELTYPWGIGAFDGYTYPARAVIKNARREGGKVILAADLEKLVKAQRRYETVREPFTPQATRGLFRIRAESRYLVVDSKGRVIDTGEARHVEDGSFEITLPEDLAAGRYTVLAGIFPDGNTLRPGVTLLHFDAGT